MKPQLKTFREVQKLPWYRTLIVIIAVVILVFVGWSIRSVTSSPDRAGGVENQSPAALSTTETEINGSLDDQGPGVLPPIECAVVYYAPEGRYFFTFIDGEMYRINLTGLERYHVTAYLEAPQ